MSLVNGVLIFGAVGIPSGNYVILYLNNLDGVALCKGGFEHELVLSAGILAELLLGIDLVNGPAVNTDQIIAVSKSCGSFGAGLGCGSFGCGLLGSGSHCC